ESAIPLGQLPLAAWTYAAADETNFIYLIQRTADSGTRRCETAQEYYQFGDSVGIYIYDHTNNYFFQPDNSSNSLVGSYPYGVVGAAGNGNANLHWRPGDVGGREIENEINSA